MWQQSPPGHPEVTGDIVHVCAWMAHAQNSVLESSTAGQRRLLLRQLFVPFRDELYLLQTEHQRSSTLHLIHLPAPVDCLFDDVSKTVIVLKTEKEIYLNITKYRFLLAQTCMVVSFIRDYFSLCSAFAASGALSPSTGASFSPTRVISSRSRTPTTKR